MEHGVTVRTMTRPYRPSTVSTVIAVLAAVSVSGCSSLGTQRPPFPTQPTALRAPRADRAGSAALKPLACSALVSLRAAHRQMRTMKNPATGDSLEYLVVGDGALAKDVLVYFPGTGQIVPGWPVQLITNSTYSPNSVKSLGYRKSEDGTVSLCHDYRLVFFDYPGVGTTPSVTYTRDGIASDVDAMLNEITRTYGISTDTVDPIGWSLGTTMALKYTFLSPTSRPERKIRDVVLYSAHGGGSEQAGSSGQAACVDQLFDASLSASGELGRQIKGDLTKLIFPYSGQKSWQSGTKSGCTATVGNDSVALSVTPTCTSANGCTDYIDGYLADILTEPWKKSQGIDDAVYTQEREQSGDWDVAYCSKALPDFTSGECTAYGTIQQSPTNGGICKTNTTEVNAPVSVVCDRLKISGRVTLLDGFEDLLVQWTYDRALAKGLNAARPGLAAYIIYPGASGHGILIQHPKWSQAETFAALQN